MMVILAVCCGLIGGYIGIRWLAMYDEGTTNDLTIYKNDLADDRAPTLDWVFFRNWDFPTGKCESRIDIPMVWIGSTFLGVAALSTLGCFKMNRETATTRQKWFATAIEHPGCRNRF